VSSGGVLPTPTDVAEPGPEARAVAAENARRTLLVDDGSSRGNPSPVPFGATATDPIRRGDLATGLEGILHFDRGVFRLQPTGTVGFAERNPREPAPTVAGDIKIASFNVLNYFTTLGSRGARTAAEFEQQEAKVVAAISGLGADVVALQEIESKRDATDPTRNQPSETLVAALDERDGAGTWAATRIPRNFTGTDVITTAIIYRTDRVRTVGDPLALDDPAFHNARQPIAQTFESDGERFTVVANHFKSKSCGTGAGAATGADADTGDGQGCWNPDRVKQAGALAGFVTRLADLSDDDDVIVLGDLNAYTKEDPLDVLRASGLLDQRRDLPRETAYSYVFDGGQGVLDHALATPTWDARRTGAAAWHLNADEPDAYEYDGVDALYAPGPFRSSDHDPLLLGYARDAAPTCLGEPATIVGTDAAEKLTGTDGRDVIVGRGGDDLIVAAGGHDLVCGGPGDDRLYGNNGKDRLAGGTGDDEVQGGNGDDELDGGAGDDRLEGGNGDDRVIADAMDTIHGGRGDTVVTRP
jgi:predicted extracellular nuclease